ncbi:MAG: 2-C-methyl-D-erythritol 4-phosphate cytidylyltransferase [Pseudomonadales bacterium]
MPHSEQESRASHSWRGKAIWAVVPAAGGGRRFGGDVPKQYAQLNGQAVLAHSLATLALPALVEKIVVVLAPGDHFFASIEKPAQCAVSTAVGGNSRAESVMAGLRSLQDFAAADDWVLVHDAARPLLGRAALVRLLTALRDDAVGGLLALPVHDTVKLACDKLQGHKESEKTPQVQSVERTLDRQRIWLAQTPQMFRYQLLCDALQMVLDSYSGDTQSATDEASAMELAGHRVRLVRGDAQNIKITTQADLQLASHYLLCREPSDER